MKAILISIRPQWVELILNGIKKYEIRKGTAIGKAINRLIEEQGVAPMLLYCTKDKKIFLRDFRDKKKWAAYWRFVAMGNDPSNVGKLPPILNGKVVARFWCDKLDDYVYGHKWSWEQGAPMWGADNSYEKILKDMCLTDEELRACVDDLCFSAIPITKLEIFDKPKEISEFKHLVKYKNCADCPYNHENMDGDICSKCEELKPLTRAPQSWCYVEV